MSRTIRSDRSEAASIHANSAGAIARNRGSVPDGGEVGDVCGASAGILDSSELAAVCGEEWYRAERGVLGVPAKSIESVPGVLLRD